MASGAGPLQRLLNTSVGPLEAEGSHLSVTHGNQNWDRGSTDKASDFGQGSADKAVVRVKRGELVSQGTPSPSGFGHRETDLIAATSKDIHSDSSRPPRRLKF